MTATQQRRPSVVPERLAWNGWGTPPLCRSPRSRRLIAQRCQVSRFQCSIPVSSRQAMGTTDAPGRTRTDALKAATPGLCPIELPGHLSHYNRPPARRQAPFVGAGSGGTNRMRQGA